jgi:hypothetical protein
MQTDYLDTEADSQKKKHKEEQTSSMPLRPGLLSGSLVTLLLNRVKFLADLLHFVLLLRRQPALEPQLSQTFHFDRSAKLNFFFCEGRG